MARQFFICEICKKLTPIDKEGSEPNTCAMCTPYREEEKPRKFFDL